MDMMKIEKVIVGNETGSTTAEIKTEPVDAPLQSLKPVKTEPVVAPLQSLKPVKTEPVVAPLQSLKPVKTEPVVAPLQSYQHESVQCFQCFITFRNSKAKERHMRKSHRDQYKQLLQQDNTVFLCYKCDKSFNFSEELSQHQATHSQEEKPFLCVYCQKNFFTFTELNKHRRHECIGRQCPCKDCGALFTSAVRLRNHRIAVHLQGPVVEDDSNTYQCCKCSRGFQTEEELLEHQERFANDVNCDVKPPGKKRGRKPKNAIQGVVECKKIKQEEEAEYNDSTTEDYPSNELQPELNIPCSEANCDLIFPSVVSLRAHKREVHGPPSRIAHACTDCNEPKQLKTHLVRDDHSGHTCPTCGKSFARESALKAHQSTHTDGKEAAGKR